MANVGADTFKCTTCEDTGVVDDECDECWGSAEVECYECFGDDDNCDVCDGSGMVTCDECIGGEVEVECEDCPE